MAVEFCSVYTHKHKHDNTTQASPVHVRRPAAGGVLCPPPSRWGRTDRRLSCSLSPGSHRCRWAGTLPALVPAWDRGFTEGHWHYGGWGGGVLGCQLQRWRLYHLPWNQSSFWSKRWSNWNCWPPLSDSTQPNGTTEEDNFALKPGFYQLYKIFMV